MTRRLARGLWLIAATLALGAAGCGTLVLHNVQASGDSWTMTVTRFSDGPDSFTTGGFGATSYTPIASDKFFHAWIKLRNDARVPRAFNFDRCDLDAGNDLIVPGVISDSSVLMKADRVVAVAPGDSVGRILVFSYPRAHVPRRFSCAPMVIPLPPIAPR